MAPVKAFLVGLAAVSLCMANISGIVTDTGAAPIAGAVVQLEKGGQKDTTDVNGKFSLVMGNTANPPRDGTLTLIGLSARISGNLMTVMVAKRSAVKVTMLDLTGKVISNVRYTMDAGAHSIALPRRGAGIYVHTVKSSNREIALKGNSIGLAPSGNAVTSHGTSSDSPFKQAKAIPVVINDVIAVTKTGYLNYRCVQYSSDTSGIAIKMIICADTVRDIDGNVYQAVRIGNQVWMAENLRVTKHTDGSAIPLDTSAATWTNATTPKYCFYNNTADTDTIKKYGALYTWYVANPANPKNLAPAGWHVPSDSEWTIMEKYLVLNGYNWDGTTDPTVPGTFAKSMAASTDWARWSIEGTIGCNVARNNSSGFSAIAVGCRSNTGFFYGQSYLDSWWSATRFGASYPLDRNLYYDVDYLYRHYDLESCGFSIRLVRDN